MRKTVKSKFSVIHRRTGVYGGGWTKVNPKGSFMGLKAAKSYESSLKSRYGDLFEFKVTKKGSK